MKKSVQAMVQEALLSELEKGNVVWHQPWFGVSGAYNRLSLKPYSGMNQLILATDHEYATFKQISEEGGKVSKGSKAKDIFFFTFKTVRREEVNAKGEKEEVEEEIPIWRYSKVFDVEKDTDLTPKKDQGLNNSFDEGADDLIGAFLDEKGIVLVEEGKSVSSTPTEIKMPKVELFTNAESYYQTLFKEVIKLTADDLGRNYKDPDKKEVREELISEIGSSILLNLCGLDSKATIKNSAAYIKKWIDAAQEDKNLFVWASSRAFAAANYIAGEDEH